MTQDVCAFIRAKQFDDTNIREEYISAVEIAQILQEFKRDRYYSDLGMCTLILPKKYWKCAENFLGIINETCEGIYAVNPDMYEKINEILEHLAYCWIEQSVFLNLFLWLSKNIKLTKGVWDEKKCKNAHLTKKGTIKMRSGFC